MTKLLTSIGWVAIFLSYGFERIETRAIELKNCHGFRHVYAQTRYKELTRLKSPINGGLQKKTYHTHKNKRTDSPEKPFLASWANLEWPSPKSILGKDLA